MSKVNALGPGGWKTSRNLELTAAAAAERLTYDPLTGKLYHRGNWRTRDASREAGSIGRYGYIMVTVAGYRTNAHRLAWLFAHGEWPPGEIDHIDGDKTNNRIENLRVVSRRDNLLNRPVRKDSRSGIKGVSAAGEKWKARLRIQGKMKLLGRFSTIEEAVAAVNKARALP